MQAPDLGRKTAEKGPNPERRNLLFGSKDHVTARLLQLTILAHRNAVNAPADWLYSPHQIRPEKQPSHVYRDAALRCEKLPANSPDLETGNLDAR